MEGEGVEGVGRVHAYSDEKKNGLVCVRVRIFFVLASIWCSLEAGRVNSQLDRRGRGWVSE